VKTSLFTGFSSEFIQTARGRFHLRRSGNGAPLLLIHGFPQSHACWSEVAPVLGQTREVICIDLLGYGHSDCPPGDALHLRYSKQEMALDCLAVLDEMGIENFSVAGHDRGAFVACRLALTAPERVTRLIVMDNLPTFVLWDRIHQDASFIPHWREMATSTSESMLTGEWMEALMRNHTATRRLDCFNLQAMDLYRESWANSNRVHGFAEDYRAGAGPDVALDRKDFAAGKRILTPTLILWGQALLGQAPESPLETWRRTLIPNAVGAQVPGGHFNAEEAPHETVAAMNAFLR
jgi:haloacetate dehalogenase